jgi:hydrophobe/amphiphile efflux-3 (HAE3) family protein
MYGLGARWGAGWPGCRGASMRRYWEWLGLNLGKRAGTVAIIGLFVTFALGAGIVKLRFTTSNADYLNRNDAAWIDNINYEHVFGGDPMAILFTMQPGTTVDNFFTQSNQDQLQAVARALANDHWVFSAVTPLDAMQLGNNLLQSPTGSVLNTPAALLLESALARDHNQASANKRTNYLITEARLYTAIPPSQRVLTNPDWVHFVVHEPDNSVRQSLSTFVPNDHHLLMAVYLKGDLNINQETAAASSVTKIIDSAHFQGATVITTGVPALLKTINDYLKHGILSLAGVAGLVMVAILLLSFSVRWRLLPFAIVALGMVWGFGLVGYFGVSLTLATIAALPVLLGVGMDYAIQMHSRIEEEVVLDRAAHPIQASARGLGPALLVVTFDTVFAFTALWFAKTPAIREFGSLLVIGIIAVCVCSIIATLAVLGIREYKSPTKGKDFSHGILSRTVAFLGRIPERAAIPLAAAAVAVFLGGLAVEGRLVLQTDPIQWVNPQAQSIKDINQLKADTGSDNELAMRISAGQAFSDQAVSYVADFSRQLQAKYPHELWPAAGLVNTIDQFINLPGWNTVVPTGAQIEGVYLIAPEGVRKTTVADGGRAINVIFRGRTNTLDDLRPVVRDLRGGINPPPGISVAPGGIAVVGVGLVQNLEKSRTQLTYLALLFVGAFLAIRLRSLIRSLLSLVPVLVAVGAVSLIGVTFNLKLSPVTSVAGPLVVAVCTEFTSLILLRFVEERGRGLEPRQAMDATARRTGRAFMVSGMTAVAGVAVLATSSMPLLRDFGIIVGLNVFVALLSALVVLPPILVWADRRNWVSRGLMRLPRALPYLRANPRVRAPARARRGIGRARPRLCGRDGLRARDGIRGRSRQPFGAAPGAVGRKRSPSGVGGCVGQRATRR